MFNGVVVPIGRHLDYESVATYSCNNGFSVVGGNTRTCTGDGSSTTGAFTGVAPTCGRELESFMCTHLLS